MDEIEDFEAVELLRQYAKFLINSGKDDRAHDMAYAMLKGANRIEAHRIERASLLQRWAKADLDATTNYGRAIVAERKLEKLIESMP